jgi:CO/xanthine dehydrogenase Mo-binding subunit
MKTGVRRDGTLVARQATIVWAQGAYADLGAVIARNASYCSLGPYRLPHASIDAFQVYTNRQPGGGFRGLGIPQVAWAGEQQIDRVARELGLDPLELRLRNIYVDGDVSVTGERLAHVGVRECLERAAAAIGWEKSRPSRPSSSGHDAPLRGRGVACILKSTLTPTSSFGYVKLDGDGSAEVITSAVEHGQGAHTVLTQIAAEELRIPMDRIRCVMPDTHVTPYDRSSTSSRTTFHMGNVVRLAAADVRNQLVGMAATLLEVHRDDLVAADGAIGVRGVPGQSLTYAQIIERVYGGPGSILGRGLFTTKPIYDPMNLETGQSRRPTAFWMFAAQAAEVEVDPETGQVRLTQLVSAVDAGRAINPLACVQQVEGSAVLGMGMALMEEMAFDAGRTLNPTFLDYKLPTTADMPRTHAIVVEAAHADGPYGAKGVGESATAPVPAAVGNAVLDATGVQIKDLPIRAEKVYRALRARR